MGTFNASWEDDDNNRQVAFSVGYALENDRVEITSVTPTKVSFVCPNSGEITRSIGIHTAHGRDFLASKIRQSAELTRVEQEINDSMTALV